MEAIVEYNYVAKEPDELTLRKGDIIKEIKVMLGGWWEGTLRDKRGMFPDNFVKVLEPSSSNASVSTDGDLKPEEVALREGGAGRRWCKVLFSYEPCNEDELTLVPQDSIEFLGEVEEGWWRGKLRGRVGVFPSNFVTPPTYEPEEKHKQKDKKELCRVLFPYEADNEDELTLIEGDIITLISRDAPDKGWWKGELRGQIGLFPDNFVEVITAKSEHKEPEQRHDTNQLSTKSAAKHAHQLKKSEKAHVRKSLDVRNTDHFASTETNKKIASTPSSSTTTSLTSPLSGVAADKPSLLSGLKRLVGDTNSNNGGASSNVGLGEELDGIERGEGAPLSHLTASRAKAPRRRLPSSQHLRHHSNTSSTTPVSPSAGSTLMEDHLANGNTDNTLEPLREDENDGLAVKARKKAPWVEELKMNQLEKRKAIGWGERTEIKKEKGFSRRFMMTTNMTDNVIKQNLDTEDANIKEKEKKLNTYVQTDHGSTGATSAFVPYHLYAQLLERVTMLEEKHEALQQTIEYLSEQLVSLLPNASTNNKV